MKKFVICILSMVLLLSCLCACDLTNPVPTTSTESPTESTPVTYQILYAKVNIEAGLKMTAENIDTYFEARSTIDVNIANQGIPYKDRYAILEGVYTQREIYQGSMVVINDFSKTNKVSDNGEKDGYVLIAIDGLTDDDIKQGDLVYVKDWPMLYNLEVAKIVGQTGRQISIVLYVLVGEQSRALIEAAYQGDVVFCSMDSYKTPDTQYTLYQVKKDPLSCNAVVLHFLDDDSSDYYVADRIRFTFDCTYLDLLLRDQEFVGKINNILQTCQKADIPFNLKDYVTISPTTTIEEHPSSPDIDILLEDNRPSPEFNQMAIVDAKISKEDITRKIDTTTYTPDECINKAKYTLVSGIIISKRLMAMAAMDM